MATETTRSEFPVLVPALYMAIETGATKWKVGFSTGLGQRPRIRTVDTGDLETLAEEIQAAKRRFELAADAPVYNGYEAGRDGFWIDRALRRMGVHNQVLDSSSIQVERRARRAKSDRLDVAKLVIQVIRLCRGEDKVCRVCRPPTPEAEDLRQLNRELETAKSDRTRSINRIKSYLATQGIYLRGELPDDLGSLRIWDGSALPERLRRRIEREREKLQFVEQQIGVLEAERRTAMRDKSERAAEIARKLQRLYGLGPGSSWQFAAEIFAWRRFQNGRQLGALMGLTPTPHQSGTLFRELGISKAGNRRVRWMLIEIAWGWLEYQPQSALTQWYNRKYAGGSKIERRKGIVALARKLLIALWKYVEYDELPEGAVLKA